tara:strand:- start:667 stop:1245 length:579 start_codon:yes stop_codon:yes gene_type:complete
MAYGKIKVDTVIYDNAGSDVEVAVSGIPSAADVNAKAPLASPALTGTPTAPTAASGTNTTQIATTAFVEAATTGGVSLDTANTWTKGQRGEVTALTDAATITPDLNDSNNYSVVLAGNRTLDNPTNCTAGQSGSIFIVQDGTGSRTLSWGSYWDFAGGTAPTLTTTAAAVDRVDYVVRSASSIHAVYTGNYS